MTSTLMRDLDIVYDGYKYMNNDCQNYLNMLSLIKRLSKDIDVKNTINTTENAFSKFVDDMKGQGIKEDFINACLNLQSKMEQYEIIKIMDNISSYTDHGIDICKIIDALDEDTFHLKEVLYIVECKSTEDTLDMVSYFMNNKEAIQSDIKKCNDKTYDIYDLKEYVQDMFKSDSDRNYERIRSSKLTSKRIL